ncbi:hypothetical protein [Pandoraea apista]|uniref:Uncharacterized protein n=1 Tax=Pandoraea apista TaxID=93218 RepID=A0A5E5NYQ1_9BURK|nr:hypothetical protein [Pandoraea apista]OXS94994.1 hypothetical protein B7H01_10990 [Pandoraea apista]VVG69337.1 hypothetical protein PAP18089_00290 [Pandoraea apista]
MPSETQNFEREKLYEEIWSEPVSKVAKKYQISDVGLRKICVNLSIPVPPVGYWAKIAAGQTVKRPSLAPTKGPTTYQRTVYKDPQNDERSMRTQARIDEDAAHAPEVPVVAPRTSIDDCLPLIKRMAKKLEGKLRDSRDWPFCDGAGLMRLSVSQQNSLRALLVLNQLLETLSTAGYRLSTADKEEDPAYVAVLDAKLTFRLKERGRQERVPLTREEETENRRLGYNRHSQRYVYHATNELEISVFHLGHSYAEASMADSRSVPIETKIQAFVGRLRHLVIRNSVNAEIAAEQRVIAAAKEAERARLEEIRRVELDRLKQVEEWASKFERANRLRALASEFESKELTASDDVINAAWIRRAADWLDPTVDSHWDAVDDVPPRYGGW